MTCVETAEIERLLKGGEEGQKRAESLQAEGGKGYLKTPSWRPPADGLHVFKQGFREG